MVIVSFSMLEIVYGLGHGHSLRLNMTRSVKLWVGSISNLDSLLFYLIQKKDSVGFDALKRNSLQ